MTHESGQAATGRGKCGGRPLFGRLSATHLGRGSGGAALDHFEPLWAGISRIGRGRSGPPWGHFGPEWAGIGRQRSSFCGTDHEIGCYPSMSGARSGRRGTTVSGRACREERRLADADEGDAGQRSFAHVGMGIADEERVRRRDGAGLQESPHVDVLRRLARGAVNRGEEGQEAEAPKLPLGFLLRHPCHHRHEPLCCLAFDKRGGRRGRGRSPRLMASMRSRNAPRMRWRVGASSGLPIKSS